MNALLRIIAGALLLVAALLVVSHSTENSPAPSVTTESAVANPASHDSMASDLVVTDASTSSSQEEIQPNTPSISRSADEPIPSDHIAESVAEVSTTDGSGADNAPDEITEDVISDSARPSSPSPGSIQILSPDHARAIEFRRSLRAEVEQMEDSAENFTVLRPAAWVDLGDDPSVPAEHSAGIQQIADELKEQIEKSDLDPASPEYRRLWNRAVRESDWKFRARYGARAWTRHHIQAHHMAAANNAE